MSETTAMSEEKGKKAKDSDDQATSLNMDELRELADLVDEHGFTDFEFENENIRVRLSKTAPAPIMQAYPAPAAAAPASNPAPAAAGDTAAADPDDSLFKIVSPIVGTFYRAPSPDKDPYVSEGSTVGPESIVCIVEAMKLMNEIQAETAGEIVKVYVENGQPVEFGQPLFGVKK